MSAELTMALRLHQYYPCYFGLNNMKRLKSPLQPRTAHVNRNTLSKVQTNILQNYCVRFRQDVRCKGSRGCIPQTLITQPLTLIANAGMMEKGPLTRAKR